MNLWPWQTKNIVAASVCLSVLIPSQAEPCSIPVRCASASLPGECLSREGPAFQPLVTGKRLGVDTKHSAVHERGHCRP